jgi:hypothetical protein
MSTTKMLQKGFSFCHINATIRKEHLFPFIQIMGFFCFMYQKGKTGGTYESSKSAMEQACYTMGL